MFRAIIPLVNDIENLMFHKGEQPPPTKKPNVLVVGYGWAGRAFCENIDRSKYDVNIVSPTSYFLNTPKLVQFPKLNYPRKLLTHNVAPVTGTLSEVLPMEKKIELKHNVFMPYDYLVLAVGSVPNTFGIKGAETCHFLKTLNDFGELHNLIHKSPDKVPTFEVIGGGPTGVEVAFELAAAGARVTLVEAAPDILSGWNNVTRRYIYKELKEAGVEVLVGSAVKEIGTDLIHTSTGTLQRNNTIWTSGVKAPDFISSRRLNATNYYLQVNHINSVFAIGDIIAGPPGRGHGPPTAQNAVQQGKFLASYFNSGFSADHPEYKYNEFCRILHTKNSIYIEYHGTTYTIPKMLGWILDALTGI